jgi:tRNA-specific 2-thiouridylase
MSTKPIVAIAMSGGVDSSVAAALLIDQGYTVIGLMLRLWSEKESDRSNRCCTPESIALARQVAACLSIPFYVIDARQIFFEAVVKPFICDYTHNLTPNPCINCNKLIRWGYLLSYALSAGADFLATGHYARLAKPKGETIQLLRGIDPRKDQSYVLHVLNQEQLAHTMFPLGEYEKPLVRSLARHYNLPVAGRPDSQDLCFVGGNGDYRQFLVRNVNQAGKPGDIVDQQGKLLGRHQGLAFNTIGQRKGLGIVTPGPWYVLDKDITRNELVVGPCAQRGRSSLSASPMNWVSGNAPESPFTSQVKIRYRSQDIPATVESSGGSQITVNLEKPAFDITPGQAAVLYNGEVCLGGGTIMNPVE